jgi:hypothetical protein
MKLRFFPILFAFLTAALPALPARAADAVFPTGSRAGFVPPPGFALSNRFPGFENTGAGSSMMIFALPPEAYGEAELTMSADAVKQHGITEEKRQALTLPSGGRALLVTGTETDNGEKFRRWMFLGLVPEATALVSVSVPETSLATYSDDVIGASLLTLAGRASVPIEELLTLVPFRLDALAGLRPIRVLGSNGVLLTAGASDAPGPGEQPVFVVSIGTGGPEEADARANYARNLFTGLTDFKNVQVVSTDMLRLGGGSMPTHELQAQAMAGQNDKPVKLVQWVRFGAGLVIRMVGIAPAEQWTAALAQFRTVRDGIAIREP